MRASWFQGLVVTVLCAGSVLITGCGAEVVVGAGSGGAGSGSAGSGGGETSVPPPDGCFHDPATDPGAGDVYARLKWAFVEHWRGVAKTPDGWVNAPEYPVDFVFSEDGYYISNCLIPDCSALYYGADGAGPLRTYSLKDVLADGTGVGRIDIYFEDSGGAVTTGTLEDITFSDDLSQLGFAFYPSWLADTIGPMRYELSCAAP